MPMFNGRPVTPGQLVALTEITRDLRKTCADCYGSGYILLARGKLTCRNTKKTAECKTCDGNGTVQS